MNRSSRLWSKLFRYLTGNPCVDHEGYRDYVIATLPQLQVCCAQTEKRCLIESEFLATGWQWNFQDRTNSSLASKERFLGKSEADCEPFCNCLEIRQNLQARGRIRPAIRWQTSKKCWSLRFHLVVLQKSQVNEYARTKPEREADEK